MRRWTLSNQLALSVKHNIVPLVQNLKKDFRDLCGLLSVEEIMSNGPLIRVIERLERMLLAVEAEGVKA